MKKLFVGNLSYNVKTDAVKALFSTVGFVTNVSVSMDPSTGKARGFAFVTYKDDIDAENALKSLEGTLLDGRRISVKEAIDRPRQAPTAFSTKVDNFAATEQMFSNKVENIPTRDFSPPVEVTARKPKKDVDDYERVRPKFVKEKRANNRRNFNVDED